MEFVLFELAVLAALLVCSAFFSSAETSFFSLTSRQLETLRFAKHPRIELIERMLNQPRRLIVTILIGNEFVNVAASVLSAALVIEFLGATSKWMNLLVMVPVLLLVGEITPKTLALRHNVAFAAAQSRPLAWFAWLITPLREVVRWIADLVITLLVGKERSRGNIITGDMVRTLTEEAVGEGALDATEAAYINRVLDLRHMTAVDLMTPRSHIQFLPVDMPVAKMVKRIRKRGHTRIPVYRSKRDRIVGVLHARDLRGKDLASLDANPAALRRLLRPPHFVPESKPAIELFHGMRARHQSLAFAVDEYGGVTGLVTMEDLLAHIFGERQLATSRKTSFHRLGPGRYRLSGKMTVWEFNERAGTTLPATSANTIGGLLLAEQGELPRGGTIIEHGGLRFTVTAVHKNRIHTVIVDGIVLPDERDARFKAPPGGA